MKKIMMFIVVAILLITGIEPIASTVQLEYEMKSEKIIFTRLYVEENEYTTLKMNGTNSYLIAQNKPLIPKYTKTITFPGNTVLRRIECTIGNLKRIDITKQLEPSPRVISINSNAVTAEEKTSYSLQKPYPERWYTYEVGHGIVDNERKIIVKIDIFPLRYYPHNNSINYAEDIEIKIQYKTKKEDLNNDETYELLILTPGTYVDALQPLVDHKNTRNLTSKIVTLNGIIYGSYFPPRGRDTIEKIKYFIKDAIENWDIKNVLIIGDANDFPARESHIYISEDDNEIFVTDLYYADIYDEEYNFSSWDSNKNDLFAEYNWNESYDEMDLYPDVRIGRLACTTQEQVETCVNKIIHYETSKAWTKDWFNNIMVIGGDTAPNDNNYGEDVDEGELVNQAILDIMDGFIADKIWDSNKRLSSWTPTGVENINNGFLNGCGFVDWSGHGSPSLWTTFPHNGDRQSLPTPLGYYKNTYLSDLENGEKLPIAINGGCSLAKYNTNENCFAWSYLSNPNGGGIASVGCTGLGYIYIGSYVTYGLVEGMAINMFNAYGDGAFTFGEMWSDAIIEYIHSRMGAGDYKTLLEWQPFGDPTLQIQEESQPPLKPEPPSGEIRGKCREAYTYSTFTTDPEEDEIYYRFDWGDNTYSEWLGPYDSGEICDDGEKSWDVKGNYEIRVQAKDEHGVLSAWSDPLALSMPKTKVFTHPIVQFLKNHPYVFPILQRLLGV